MIRSLAICLLGFIALGSFSETEAQQTEAQQTEAQQAELTHGPMLGHLDSHSVRIWARTSKPTQFQIRYGTDKDSLDQISQPIETKLKTDCASWTTITDLKHRTKYYYQIVIDGKKAGLAGSFKTFADPAIMKESKFNPEGKFNFRFEFACGNNQSLTHSNGPSMPTYTTMLREVKDKVDFAILNGDWIYEEQRGYPIEKWKATMLKQGALPELLQVAPATVGAWENYKVYMSRAANLAEWHRHVPSYYTFDDHELLNDIYGCGEIGRRHRHTVFRDVATNAWYDYLGWSNPTATSQPIHFGRATLKKGSDILTDLKADFTKIDLSQATNLHVHWNDPQAGVREREYSGGKGDPNAGVYEIVEFLDKNRVKIRPPANANSDALYSIGRESYGKFTVSNCDFYLLDTRSNRQMHDVTNPAKKGLTMLGKRQRDWLMKEMKASKADFFFVVSSVNFMIPHVGSGGKTLDSHKKADILNKDDAWTVFLDEREALIDFWSSLEKPVFVLTGDLHNSYAIKVTDNVWEFASGPHNSLNHRSSDEGDRPANGRYQYGPRPCEIRWSSYSLPDVPRPARTYPKYCVVQVNNVFNNPQEIGKERWIAYPEPQVIFQYFDGKTGDLSYAETISKTATSKIVKRKTFQKTPSPNNKK